jgi:hypothetical protein
MITKYKISKENSSIEFSTIELANQYRQQNEGWSEPEKIEEQEPVEVITVPDLVPLWCLRTVLITQSLLQPVKDAITQIQDPMIKIAAEQGIEYANTVSRQSPTTSFIHQVLGLTNEQVDKIFINADKVSA